MWLLRAAAGGGAVSRAVRSYGPRQFPAELGLQLWEFARALETGLIPAAGEDGRWPAAVVEDARGRLEQIRERVGDLPDCGATRAAAAMAERLGVAVLPSTVRELARRGLIRRAGSFKGHALYCGRSVAAFRDLAALEEAHWSGYERGRDSAADYLRVRQTDVEHLIRAGRLRPSRMAESTYQPRRWGATVPLFRTGDLDALLADESIDWVAVRAARRGQRSPLAKLPDRPVAVGR